MAKDKVTKLKNTEENKINTLKENIRNAIYMTIQDGAFGDQITYNNVIGALASIQHEFQHESIDEEGQG